MGEQGLTTKILSKDELWWSVLGGSALATGGGGAASTYERFCQAVDPVLDAGLKPKLMDVKDLSDDAAIYMPIGIGGGVTREDRERYGPPIRGGPYADIVFKEIDRVFPLLKGTERPGADFRAAAVKRLKEIKGEGKYSAYLAGELGPGVFRQSLEGSREEIPLLDADGTGARAVPELSLIGFNVKNVASTPAVIATSWGDLLVYEKYMSWQRLEDITRAIALISGGSDSTSMSFKGKDVKASTVPGTISLAIKVGKAIQDAVKAGKSPVDKIVESTNGYKIFEGEVVAYSSEGKWAFNWGNAWIKGTDDFEGKLFRFWFKNENQISWLDGEPYVTCPDPFTVIDIKTGEGLSNFRADAWTSGRKVAVVGVKSADIWRTKRGLSIYNPQHFGFDIKYRPIEKIIGK
jgi:hypothetical protein